MSNVKILHVLVLSSRQVKVKQSISLDNRTDYNENDDFMYCSVHTYAHGYPFQYQSTVMNYTKCPHT